MMQAQPALPVHRLVGLLQELVEENFMEVRVAGEVSNFAAPASGHWYFTLKDAQAQLRTVMFRPHNRLAARPEDGMQVVCSGRVSVYPQRGELQLVATSLEPCGQGRLQAAFDACKARLAAEGLFAEERKRPLPPYPRTIGVVTSASGAALHDILTVLARRHAGLRVLLRPVAVQGEAAAGQIAEAIADLNRQGEAEVLIVGRGGGSLEDLWAFNEEVVARAIVASQIPVISAVGHEIDVTIADFAADLRAATPSAAAELVVKNRLELERHLDQLCLRLSARMRDQLRLWQERLAGLTRRLRSPRQAWELRQRQLLELATRLRRAMQRQGEQADSRLRELAGRLDNLSPLKTLERGYAVATGPAGRPVTDAAALAPGDPLQLRFARGRARARVEEVES